MNCILGGSAGGHFHFALCSADGFWLPVLRLCCPFCSIVASGSGRVVAFTRADSTLAGLTSVRSFSYRLCAVSCVLCDYLPLCLAHVAIATPNILRSATSGLATTDWRLFPRSSCTVCGGLAAVRLPHSPPSGGPPVFVISNPCWLSSLWPSLATRSTHSYLTLIH